MKSFLTLTSLALATLASTATAHVGLTRSGGVLGDSITYNLEGDPFEFYIFVPSTNFGPTPLAVLDPNDPRMAQVGIDLINYIKVGPLNNKGEATLNVPLPADPNLSGLTIYSQLFTAPGATTLVDELSAGNAVVLGASGESFPALGGLAQPVAGYATAAVPSGQVVTVGGGFANGVGGTTASSFVHLFDPQTQTFDLGGAISYASINAQAVTLADGRVFVCGGIDGDNNVLSNAAIYDPVTQTASPAAPMSTPRVQHTATLLADGRVFVTGGTSSINASDPLASLTSILKTSQLYNPATNTWSNAAPMPNPRIGHAATLLPSGRVLITGGLEVTIFIIPIPAITNSALRYNPVGNSMFNTASMPGDRALHGQITLADGRALVAGGADGDVLTQNFFSLNSVCTYDESTGAWTSQSTLPEVRTYPNLVEVAGEVHVLSGLGTIDVLNLTGTPVTSIARASVANFSWSTVGNLSAGRPFSTARSVENGDRVLVLGPSSATDTSVDVYIP